MSCGLACSNILCCACRVVLARSQGFLVDRRFPTPYISIQGRGNRETSSLGEKTSSSNPKTSAAVM